MRTSLFTVSEASAKLRCGESWLRQRVARKEVSHYKLAGKTRFSEEHLASIAAMFEVHAEPELHPLIEQGNKKP